MTIVAVHPDQLALELQLEQLEQLDAAHEASALEADLRDRRRISASDGAARLLFEIARRGCPVEALPAAAALVLAADEAARERRERRS